MFYNERIKNDYLKYFCSSRIEDYLANNQNKDKESAIKLFNTTLKIPYTDRKPLLNSEKNIASFFNKFSKAEIKKRKDLMDFTDEEFIEATEEGLVPTYQRMKAMAVYLWRYRQWANSKGYISDEQAKPVSPKLIEETASKIDRRGKFFSEAELRELQSALPNPRERFLLQCLCEGIKGRNCIDIAQLKLSDIRLPENLDEAQMTDEDHPYIVTLFSGKKKTVSKRLYDLALETDDSLDYTTLTPMNSSTYLLPSKYIIKPKRNQKKDDEESRSRNVMMNLSKIIDYLGLDGIRPKDFITSGMLNEMQKEARKKKMSLKRYLYEKSYESLGARSVVTRFENNWLRFVPADFYKQNKVVIDSLDSEYGIAHG